MPVTRFVLDTDVLSLFMRGHDAVRERILAHPPDCLSTTIVTVEEMLSGWHSLLRKARTPPDLVAPYEHLSRTIHLLAKIRILPFTMATAQIYEGLRHRSLRVGTMDLRIAAIVLAHSGILVTRNARDFGRVPDLVIEDWTT